MSSAFIHTPLFTMASQHLRALRNSRFPRVEWRNGYKVSDEIFPKKYKLRYLATVSVEKEEPRLKSQWLVYKINSPHLLGASPMPRGLGIENCSVPHSYPEVSTLQGRFDALDIFCDPEKMESSRRK